VRKQPRDPLPQLLALLAQPLDLLLRALLLLLLLHQRGGHRLLLLRPGGLQLARLLFLQGRGGRARVAVRLGWPRGGEVRAWATCPTTRSSSISPSGLGRCKAALLEAQPGLA
jgi:hypothetical protein